MDETACLVEKKIEAIQKIKDGGKFKNYIEYIQFPFYKNLVKDTRIEFSFPLTVLVGRNGSGKSSTLHALYGAVNGKTCSDFWFSTELDPIKESGERNRYFYGYRENGKASIKEVLMLRMKRGSETKEEDPDYWETAKPQKGMLGKKRNSPVKKPVIYVDFRAELSAFDQEFHFSKKPIKERKKRLRDRAKYLKRLFDGDAIRFRGCLDESMAKLTVLDESCRAQINYILGKKYEDIRVSVDHKLYRDVIGTSVYVRTQDQDSYSEANAGSGEVAVIQLVRKIAAVPDHTLVLLDEPEVSLHPSAQRRLQEFLLEQIKHKKLQIVISTHSPILIEKMPKEAIKLYRTRFDGKFEVLEGISYQEAFFDIENIVPSKKLLICEDIAAKYLIEKILRVMDKMQYFFVEYYPGGAGTLMSKYLPVFAVDDKWQNRVFFILDGDQSREVDFDEAALTNEQQGDIEYLQESLRKVLGIDRLKGFYDGHAGSGNKEQQCLLAIRCLRFSRNVRYLAKGEIPESMVLKSDYVKREYGNVLSTGTKIDKNNAKLVVGNIADEVFGDGSRVRETMELLANQWAKEDSPDRQNLMDVIQWIFTVDKD
jgi:predicted ATPase